MKEAILWSISVILGGVGLFSVMSFVLWENAFKAIGYGRFIRLVVAWLCFIWIVFGLGKIGASV